MKDTTKNYLPLHAPNLGEDIKREYQKFFLTKVTITVQQARKICKF